jgi:hypothetical protein
VPRKLVEAAKRCRRRRADVVVAAACSRSLDLCATYSKVLYRARVCCPCSDCLPFLVVASRVQNSKFATSTTQQLMPHSSARRSAASRCALLASALQSLLRRILNSKQVFTMVVVRVKENSASHPFLLPGTECSLSDCLQQKFHRPHPIVRRQSKISLMSHKL